MADEVFVTSEDQELFPLSNGRYIMDEDQSRKMFYTNGWLTIAIKCVKMYSNISRRFYYEYI